MAHLIRGKQAGVQQDFSSAIGPELFNLKELCRYGISSQISHIAYDPVQSLIAIGTNATKFGQGQIYIYGQGRICACFQLPHGRSVSNRAASVRDVQFCSDRLVVLDSQNDLSIFSLADKKLATFYSAPGHVTAITSDPTLDYVFLGMQTGEIVAFDMERQGLAPLRIPNLWQQYEPRAKIEPVMSLQLHPRDIGKLLIGYAQGAVTYTFKQDGPQKFFHYHVPRGAPGGDSDPAAMNVARNPRLTQAIWHPTGTFVLTAHEDSSLVIWDPKEGRMILARTITDVHVDKPSSTIDLSTVRGSFAPKIPYSKIAWIANQDPDETGILVTGGTLATESTKGMTFIELARTPNYTTSSWSILEEHFAQPKRHRMLPTPPNVEVTSFCLIPRKDPWFAGAHDPVALIAVLSSGELATLSFPSAYPITPTNQLHPSLFFVHPFVTCISQWPVERTRWLGITETRSSGPKILQGGAEGTRKLKRFEDRNIIQTGHVDGTIRMWDLGHADEVENESVIQVDVARAVGRHADVAISQISYSGASGELAAGLRNGELVIFKWARNSRPGQEPPSPDPNPVGELIKVTDRKDPTLLEGLHPFSLLNQQDGRCSALKVSDVGFIAAGFEGGSIVVIDMRGPAIILNQSVNSTSLKREKSIKTAFHKRNKSSGPTGSYPTSLEFSVMTLEGDAYSSIQLHVGTSTGTVQTYKVLPSQSGRYSVEFAGQTSCEDRVIRLSALSASSGKPAAATPSTVAGLRNGLRVDGVLVAVTSSEARIFRPLSSKAASKSFDGAFCDSAAISHHHDEGIALVCCLGDGTVRSYSIPGLRELNVTRVDDKFDIKRFSEAVVTKSGDVIAWTGPSEIAAFNIWGTGDDEAGRAADKLFNNNALIPPRPTISNFQWIAGTQYITPADLDILIGGPDRPPSKRMVAQAMGDEQQRKAIEHRRAGSGSSAGAAGQTYWQSMTRAIQERTEQMNIMGDKMDNLEDNSKSWSEEVNSFVSRQKRNFVMGAVKSKFGF